MAFVLGEMAQQGLELIEYEETEGTSTQDAVQTTWGPSPQCPQYSAGHPVVASPSSGAMRRVKLTPTEWPPVETYE